MKTSSTDDNNSIIKCKRLPTISVHSILYEARQDKDNKNNAIDALYFNHGFGASSLSWLPAIPSLVKKLDAKVGIAHDAPGKLLQNIE